MILELEQAIITKLRDVLPDVQVLPFPVDPSDLGLPVTTRQIYVGFKQEDLDRVDAITLGIRTHQRRRLQYELVLRMQDLRSQQVAYPVMDAVRSGLSGYRPFPTVGDSILTGGFYQVSGGFVDFGAGLWLYSMSFAIDAILKVVRSSL